MWPTCSGEKRAWNTAANHSADRAHCSQSGHHRKHSLGGSLTMGCDYFGASPPPRVGHNNDS